MPRYFASRRPCRGLVDGLLRAVFGSFAEPPSGKPPRGHRVAAARQQRACPPAERLEMRMALDSTVVFNEIMYNLPGEDDGREWIELHNQMAVAMELTGWSIAGGVRYDFPAGTVISPAGYLVVASDPLSLAESVGVRDPLGPFVGSLDNGGERLQLVTHTGRVMDELDYDDGGDWTVAPDGSGPSLARIDSSRADPGPRAWASSTQLGGTPGTENFPAYDATAPEVDPLLTSQAPVSIHVPTAEDASLATAWTDRGFDDSQWTVGLPGVGFEVEIPATRSTPTPVGRYWPLDGDPNDRSGNGLNGRLEGPVFVNESPPPHGTGQALWFDGADDQMLIDDTEVSASWTVSAWVRPESIRGQSIVARSLGSPQTFWTHQLRMTADGRFETFAFDTTSRVIRGTTVAQAGQWYHVAASASGDGLLRLYVNGVQEGEPIAVTRFSTPTNRWHIGSASGDGAGSGPIGFFHGVIDEVAVWPAELPADRILALAAGAVPLDVESPGVTRPTPGLVRYFPLDGDALDASGHGVEGTVREAIFVPEVPLGGGQSLKFDGVNDRFVVRDEIDPTGYTLSAWVRVDSLAKSTIVARTGDPTETQASHQIRLTSSGTFEHLLFDGRLLTVSGNTVVEPGVWYHVAATAENDGEMRLFVNGVEEGSSRPVGSLWTGGDRWQVGHDFDPATAALAGAVDDVAIWSGALRADEIARLASAAPPTEITGYRAHIGTDIESIMHGSNASLWLRSDFRVEPGVYYDALYLDVQADGGFVAYLNGTEILRHNAPDLLVWNASAESSAADDQVLRGARYDISGYLSLLQGGANTLAIHALNESADDGDLLVLPRLLGQVAPPAGGGIPLRINELAASDGGFWMELHNHGGQDIDLSGVVLQGSESPSDRYRFPADAALPEGGYRVISRSELGFSVGAGDRLALIDPSGRGFLDAVRLEATNRARSVDGVGIWQVPQTPTPGGPNQVVVPEDIVINEIMYRAAPTYEDGAQPYQESSEQWVELYNRSATQAMDLSGWRLDDGIRYRFPAGTVLPPDGYLVVAKDPAALAALHAELAATGRLLGPFSGNLSDAGERITLVDQRGNLADEVDYRDDTPWPSYADGGGSSLELRDPRADNRRPESWAASDEAGVLARSAWRHYSYTATITQPILDPQVLFHDFWMGLITEGEVLLDNISVIEDPDGEALERMQNGGFDADAAGQPPATWRMMGTHATSRVEQDPYEPENNVLRLVATGPLHNLSNHAETTLAGGAQADVDETWRISFDALPIGGSPQLHTQFLYTDAARTTILVQPEAAGTPGARNSVFSANTGPTYAALSHFPVVPSASDSVVVSVEAQDPDAVESLTLLYAAAGVEPFAEVPMQLGAEGRFQASIPPQRDGTVVQFFVRGRDALGAVSDYPAAGPSSRALYRVRNGFVPDPLRHDFEVIMIAGDADKLHDSIRMMDNDRIGSTVIYNGSEIFYDTATRLKGSMFSRGGNEAGLNVEFPADHLFRGVHQSVTVDRNGNREIVVRHLVNQAGVLGGMHDDVANFFSPRGANHGPVMLGMARHSDVYLDSQFENGSDGSLVRMEGVRVPIVSRGDDPSGVNPEGWKVYQPIGGSYFELTDAGDDKEYYRWPYLMKGARGRDDYSGLMAMAKAFDLEGEALEKRIAEVIDVDEWMKMFAMMSLESIGDVYGHGGAHNLDFYVRPEDGRVLAFPWDWDFTFRNGVHTPLYGGAQIAKVIDRPVYQRLFYGHMLHMIQTVYDSDYMAFWVEHYSTLMGENFSSVLAYIDERSSFALAQFPAEFPFEITSGGGRQWIVWEETAAIRGRGWIDVDQVRLAGSSQPLDVQWLDGENWQVLVPVAPGSQTVRLEAYNRQGNLVGSAALDVERRVGEALLGDMDLSGTVDPDDIAALALALADPERYESTYSAAAVALGDFDNDGDVDYDDIAGFVGRLSSSTGFAVGAGRGEGRGLPDQERQEGHEGLQGPDGHADDPVDDRSGVGARRRDKRKGRSVT